MPNFIDSVDDNLVADGNVNFGGGMDGQIDPTMIEPNGCAEMKNMAMNRFGVITTRKGTVEVGTSPAGSRINGLSELDTATVEHLVACFAGAFYKYESSAWTLLAGFTANATAQVEMQQGVNVLYITDGVNNMRSWDGTTFTDLGTTSPNPPLAKYIVWHTNRLFAAGVTTANDTVYVSNIPDGTVWNYTTQAFRVGAGEGDAITSIGKWVGFKLVVFKNNSFYIVDADPSVSVANWGIEIGSPFIGCVAHRSVVQVGNDLYFLSRDGVRSIIRTTTAAINEVSLPLSWPMQNIIDQINWANASKACATYFDNKYILSVPITPATDNNYCIVYDTRAQRWSGYWTGWTSTIFHISKLANEKHLYFGQTDGITLEWDSDADENAVATYKDDGAEIASLIKTRAYQFQDPLSPKYGWSISSEWYQSQASASIKAILDQGGANTIDADFDTENVQNQLPVDLPFTLASIGNKRCAFDLAALGEFREIQFQFETTSGKLSLKSLTATAFPQAMKYEEGA